MTFDGALAAFVIFAPVPLQSTLVGLPLIAGKSVLSARDIRSHLHPDAPTLPLLQLRLLLSILGFGPSPLSSALGAGFG